MSKNLGGNESAAWCANGIEQSQPHPDRCKDDRLDHHSIKSISAARSASQAGMGAWRGSLGRLLDRVHLGASPPPAVAARALPQSTVRIEHDRGGWRIRGARAASAVSPWSAGPIWQYAHDARIGVGRRRGSCLSMRATIWYLGSLPASTGCPGRWSQRPSPTSRQPRRIPASPRGLDPPAHRRSPRLIALG